MKILVLFDIARPPQPDETFTPQILEKEEQKPTEADVIRCLERLGHQVDTLAVFDNIQAILDKLAAFAPDVVFNLLESVHDDRSHEPNIPALLELLKMKYTGAGPDALLLCKDKALAKQVLSYHHVRVPRFVTSHKAHPLRRLRRLGYPAFVKPVGEESSDGISKASFAKDEAEALERARFLHDKLGCDAMIEEYVEGRELYVSVIGNMRLTAFPPRELVFDEVPEDAPKFATSKAKWDDNYRKKWGIRNVAARDFAEGVEAKLLETAKRIYRMLRIRGLGRIDFRLNAQNEIYFLEANPNPSLAQEDDFAQSAAAAGLDYDALIQKILDTA